MFNWAFTLSLLAAGPFADWVRPRRSFPLGVGVWSFATALCSVTTSFAPLAVFRAFVGVGESAMIPSGSRVIRETFDVKHRALAVGTFFAGNKVGLTLGIPLAASCWCTMGMGVGVLHHRSPWLPVDGLVARGLSRAAGGRRAARSPEGGHARIRWATLLKYRTTWGVMLGQAGYLYIYYVFATWLPGYLVLQRGMSTLTTGVVGMLPFLIGTLCVVLGGWAADRLIAAGRRVTVVRKGFAVGGLLGATVFTIAGAYAPDTFLAVTFLTLFGRERQLLHRVGELDADRRGAAAYRLLAGVAAEFRRQCRRVVRAARHQAC